MEEIDESWLRWVEDSSLATTIRQSNWLYPALETVHIIGIVILVGAAFMFDLRLLGFSKNISVALLARHLLTWSRRGLFLVIPSGILLFISNAETVGNDPVFWIKLTLIVLAGVNAMIFHWFTFRKNFSWNEKVSTPIGAKAAAFFSIVLWLSVITCGRWLAY